MLNALKAWWRGLRHIEHLGYLYVWANVFAVVVSLFVVTAPAAWAGLNKMSYRAYRSRLVTVNDFWEGLRENLGRGLVLFVLNVVIIGVNVTNLLSYGDQGGIAFLLLRALWILALLLWFTLQLYLWPIFYAMEDPTLWGAFRNAGIMLLQNPGFTVGVWLGLLPVLIFSTILAPLWLLLTLSIIASIANSAVLDRLRAAGFTPQTEDEFA
ncbi:MAG: hypothetical protein SF029_06550 [bacterium]|nr:hypothetical protein [bacterium]